jgi:hypothetical protein
MTNYARCQNKQEHFSLGEFEPISNVLFPHKHPDVRALVAPLADVLHPCLACVLGFYLPFVLKFLRRKHHKLGTQGSPFGDLLLGASPVQVTLLCPFMPGLL